MFAERAFDYKLMSRGPRDLSLVTAKPPLTANTHASSRNSAMPGFALRSSLVSDRPLASSPNGKEASIYRVIYHIVTQGEGEART